MSEKETVEEDKEFKRNIPQIIWIVTQILNLGSNIDFFIKVNQREQEGSLKNDLLYFYSLYILLICLIITFPLIYLGAKVVILRHARFFTRYLSYLVLFCPSLMLSVLLVQTIPQLVITSFYLNEFEVTYSFFQAIITLLVSIWEITLTNRDIDPEEVLVPKNQIVKEQLISMIQGFDPGMAAMLLQLVIFAHHPTYFFSFWYFKNAELLPDQRSVLPVVIIQIGITAVAIILQLVGLTRRFQKWFWEPKMNIQQLESQQEIPPGMIRTALMQCCIHCIIFALSMVTFSYSIMVFEHVNEDSNIPDGVRVTANVNFWGLIVGIIVSCISGCYLIGKQIKNQNASP